MVLKMPEFDANLFFMDPSLFFGSANMISIVHKAFLLISWRFITGESKSQKISKIYSAV